MNLYKVNRRFGILTISSVFLLLIAGGVVRSTGSGMGCPDWPKCYGMLYPPMCACELPNNYQEIYVEKRVQKVKKLTSYLRAAGFAATAYKMDNDPSLREPEEFNTLKAWTEYVNRLIGVLSGLFALVYFITLFPIRKQLSRLRFFSGIAGFIFLLINAWLGSVLVATNLLPALISIHYVAAYAVLVFMMMAVVEISNLENTIHLHRFRWFYIVFSLLTLLQLIFGTQLRAVTDEAIDAGKLYFADEVNVPVLGNIFKGHWFLAILLIAISMIPPLIMRNKRSTKAFRWTLSIPIVLSVQYISGVLSLRYAFPMPAQVSHIFFAGIIFGISTYICIINFRDRGQVAKFERN